MPTYLTNEDLQNFGPEMLDLAQRAALHAVAPNLQGLEQQNAELRQQLARETKRNLDQELARAVPNWREVNRDPRFIAWLDEPDVLSGRRRQDLINEATARGDSVAIIAFFRAFLQEAGAPPAGTPPMTSSHARATDAQGKRIYTREEVARLLDPRRRGKKSDVEWERLQREIIAAAREGRIKGALEIGGK